MRASATIALLADAFAGEPPVMFHPTVWMGKWITGGLARREPKSNAQTFRDGAALVAAGVVMSAAMAGAIDAAVGRMADPYAGIARGITLKPALSLRPLLSAGREVQTALEAGQLNDARRLLSTHLVSRDTRDLSAAEVAGAAIESVAENLNDSVVAPLLAFRFGGLAAAYAFRMINTADAMLGYHTTELEWFGKAAARADDVVAFIPARLAATLICCAAPGGGGSARSAAVTAVRDARLTASPNAGWPMAAMAGALGIRLTKRSHYTLNAAGRDATPQDIARSCRIVMVSAIFAAILVDIT